MIWYVDASTLIALGSIGELRFLMTLSGGSVVLETVAKEVTTEPAATNLERFSDDDPTGLSEDAIEAGRSVLGDDEVTGDAAVIGAVLARDDVGVVSDDRRIRRTARGLGSIVTGTIGVIGRAVMVGDLDATEAKTRLDRLERQGLHMTAELRRTADSLIEDAARD